MAGDSASAGYAEDADKCANALVLRRLPADARLSVLIDATFAMAPATPTIWLAGWLQAVVLAAVVSAVALGGAAAADRVERLPPPHDHLFAVGGAIDLDDPSGWPACDPSSDVIQEDWVLQLLPDGLIYRSYLAGVKEPRLASVFNYDQRLGWIWDITLGGRVGLLRYGTADGQRPQGWQIDVEGAGMPRLDLEDERDLVAADFRAGLPITYGRGPFQTKLAYYHLSSHLGDEFMLKNPQFPRINYSRDVLVWGNSYYPTDALRLYAEAGWAFYSDVSEPWELQFGVDFSPRQPTGLRPDPFFAVNGHLRQELNFGGNLVVQTGVQWYGGQGGHRFRAGMQYFNGKSDQFELFNQWEQKIGMGLWYDY